MIKHIVAAAIAASVGLAIGGVQAQTYSGTGTSPQQTANHQRGADELVRDAAATLRQFKQNPNFDNL